MQAVWHTKRHTHCSPGRRIGHSAARCWLSQVAPAEAAAARRRADARRAEAMLVAASSGDVATVQQLLDRGCPPDACDYDKRTGLMLAAANGQEVGQQRGHRLVRSFG
jgi:ankyrin repeat protein